MGNDIAKNGIKRYASVKLKGLINASLSPILHHLSRNSRLHRYHMISPVAWKGERIFVCERKDRVGARRPFSNAEEWVRWTVEKRDCIKVGFTLKVFDPTRVSVSSRNICAHTVHGTYKVEYGTVVHGAKKGNMEFARANWGREGIRQEAPRSPPSRSLRLARANIISVFIETATIAVPGDNARGCQLVSGLQQRDPYIFHAIRYNVHSRVNIVAAMARFAAPAKNTKCKTCSAICLPLYVASGDTNFGKHKARAIY